MTREKDILTQSEGEEQPEEPDGEPGCGEPGGDPEHEPEVAPQPDPPHVQPDPPQAQPEEQPNPQCPVALPVSGAATTIESLRQLGQAGVATSPKSNIHCITIIGQIEGHISLPPQNKTSKYEHILPQLVAIEQNPQIEGILVILNTAGGDVEAGLAIAEMIASMSKPSVSLVLGGGHSIAVPVAVSCTYSFIAETATMTIHPIRLTGLLIGVPQTYEYLEKMQDRVTRFVTTHSHIEEQRFRDLMTRTGDLMRDIGSVLIGKEAVNVGLIDEMGGLSAALSKLNQLIESRRQSRQVKSPTESSPTANAEPPV